MKIAKIVSALLVSVLALAMTASAEPPPPVSLIKAPPLRECRNSETRDLGTWDDMLVCEEQELIALRRGEEIFSLPMNSDPVEPKKLASGPEFKNSHLMACAGSGDRLWLFMESTDAAPFAIDAHGRQIVRFDIPGLKISGGHAPDIASRDVVRHADAVILGISGGGSDAWVRDGNRPMYFWMSLKTGKAVAFPVNWDLNCFSSDLKTAVFSGWPADSRTLRRPLHGIDVATGERADKFPDYKTEATVTFDWSDTRLVKPVYHRRPNTGDRNYFAGVSLNGTFFPADVGTEVESRLVMAKAGDGFAAFRLRRSGAGTQEPSALWLLRLEPGRSAEPTAADVGDFALLGGGNCVYAVRADLPSGASPKEAIARRGREKVEAFFRNAQEKSAWNVLEGVERLPELDKEFADKSYIQDHMSVRLIEGSGGKPADALALCVFEHSRADMRAAYVNPRETVERAKWRRAVLLNSKGERYMTELFRRDHVPGGGLAELLRKDNAPNAMWLHNSGRLFMRTDVYPEKKRLIQLTETTLQLP